MSCYEHCLFSVCDHSSLLNDFLIHFSNSHLIEIINNIMLYDIYMVYDF